MRTLAAALEPYPFSSHWEDAAHVRVLVIRGRVDAASARHLSAAICMFSSDDVVVDLGGVHAIDTGALRDMLLAARVVGIEPHLVCLKAAPIHPVFELALVGPLTLHETRTEAVFAANSPSRTRQHAG